MRLRKIEKKKGRKRKEKPMVQYIPQFYELIQDNFPNYHLITQPD